MERRLVHSLIKKAFKIDWEPNIDNEALRIIDKCGSTTEKVYLLGAAYFIEHIGKGAGTVWIGDGLPITGCNIEHNGILYEAIWFICPWSGWYLPDGLWCGPSACAFVPQLVFPNINYHHDFGLFYGGSDGGGTPWHFKCAIEIDPETTHRDRRDKDTYRDRIVDYDVIRIYDEIHDYLSWFEVIVRRDEDEILKHAPPEIEE